jgi:hypothetical protein
MRGKEPQANRQEDFKTKEIQYKFLISMRGRGFSFCANLSYDKYAKTT